MCFAPQRRACHFFDISTSKSGPEREVFLACKCASCHNRVHFFNISTSKSGPRIVCFVHFDLETCFAPQRCALFRHRNFQKWPGAGVSCTFWFRNVLRATTACTFSSLIWPDGSTPAALASLLFDPPEPQIIGKIQCFATFLPFHAYASSFFWLFLFSHLLSTLLFSLTLPLSAFHLSISSEVWLLNYLRLQIKTMKVIYDYYRYKLIITIDNQRSMTTLMIMFNRYQTCGCLHSSRSHLLTFGSAGLSLWRGDALLV